MSISVVQTAVVGTTTGSISFTFTSALSPGNVLFFLFGNQGGAPLQNSGPTLTGYGAQAGGPGAGYYGYLMYRAVQSGDGNSFSFTVSTNSGVVAVELTGLDPGGAPSNQVASGPNANQNVSLTGTIAAITTDGSDDSAGCGTFTPNGNTTVAVSDWCLPAPVGAGIIFNPNGSTTLGGTTGGTHREASYYWGGQAFDWLPSTDVVADFVGEPLVGITPLTVQFTDLSTGDPNTWLWDFGDGQTSSDQNPAHIYTTPGVYDVSLTASRV